MKNTAIAAMFYKTADVLALKNENTFKVLAYRKIGRALEELARDVEEVARSRQLEEVPGIGKSSAEKIAEYLRTGHISEFEELWKEVPVGVVEIMNIPTVGAKTAALLWQEGGVTDIDSLKKKMEDGSLLAIKGVGQKKLDKIKSNLAFISKSSGRISIGKALPVAQELVRFLLEVPGVQKAQYCGSLRRGKETIGDIDIVVAADAKQGEAIGKAFATHHYVLEVITAGPTKTSIRTGTDMQCDLRVVPPESWGAAIQYFTGGKEHNVRVRELAQKKGMKLNEWGLFKGEKKIAGETEEGIYAALAMAMVPPEMREDKGEIEWALENGKSGTRDAKGAAVGWESLEIGDIRGELHMHTTASDGSRSIAEMVAECKRRGFAYCAITDHSKSQFQANGLKSERLLEHIKAIHAVGREARDILVLAGAEVDILADGSLDYEDDLLKQLDWVVASPHAALTQESEPATQRLVRACANPNVCVIGHPTGRLVPHRRGLEPDMQAVVFAAARNGVALEINASHHRLDLRDYHVRLAVEAKVPICIDTDAHSIEDFEELFFGVVTARRGWARKADILNCRSRQEFEKWRRERKAADGW